MKLCHIISKYSGNNNPRKQQCSQIILDIRGMNEQLLKFLASKNMSKFHLVKCNRKKSQCVTFQGSHSSYYSHFAQTCPENLSLWEERYLVCLEVSWVIRYLELKKKWK